MPLLSAILITYNEERDLPQALASLQGVADEIVVVDSGSTDRTCELARQRGARVVLRPFSGFGEQKNFAAAQASHDWVLSLDADEALEPRAAFLAAGVEDEHARLRGLPGRAPNQLPREMDPPLGLVSRVSPAAVPARPRTICRRAA